MLAIQTLDRAPLIANERTGSLTLRAIQMLDPCADNVFRICVAAELVPIFQWLAAILPVLSTGLHEPCTGLAACEAYGHLLKVWPPNLGLVIPPPLALLLNPPRQPVPRQRAL